MTEPLGEAVARLYATTDPPPPALLSAASSLLAWRSPDTALATLLLDSATAGEAAGVRGGEPPRMLSFALTDDAVLDVELTYTDTGAVHVVGQVSRPEQAPLTIRHRDGTWSGHTDALGRFAADDLPRGPLRITWSPVGSAFSTPVITA
jgi:hypothetical protein